MTTAIKSSGIEKKEFSQSEKNKIIEKLVTARIGLLLRHSFLGNMATRLILVDASDWCDTLATDGRRFFYNNSFVNRMTPKQVEFGFAHELLHIMFDHMDRRNGRDPKLSNIAADYAVNQILKDDRIGEVPNWIKIFQDNQYRGKSYEEIYDILYQNADIINIGDLGELFDDHIDGDDEGGGDGDQAKSGKRPKLTAEERKQIRDEIKEAMVAAAQSAGMDKVPAGIRRMIQDLTEPKMNWRQLLRMNIQSIVKSNFSFSKPNRKSQQSGAILPGMVFDETIHAAVAIDMSGSIMDSMVRDFLSEIKGIMDEYSDFKLDVWCFDTEVYSYVQYTADNADELLEYNITGGGGTDYMCNWNFMKNNDINPKKLIMFTDGEPYGSWGEEDYCDTLFIIHSNNSVIAPFGQTAHYSKD
jgi:predicted metal-dependent peptidase